MTVATALHLEAVTVNGFDARVAKLRGAKLTRASGSTYLECDSGIEHSIHQLALAGIRVRPCSAIPGVVGGLRAVIAFDLVALDRAFDAIDVLELEHIQLSHASATLMHRRFPWSSPSSTSRNNCRRLLREEDVVIGWRRIVWCSVASVRAVRARVRSRPVVFDRAAVARQPLRWSYASEGAIERWAFA